MTKKPRLVEWLEESTGRSLDVSVSQPPPGHDRHVSVRLPSEMYDRIESLGHGLGETISQTIRRLVAESLDRIEHPDAAALDTAIAALEALRRRSA